MIIKLIFSSKPATMPGEATETVPVTEQEMQQPQVETGSYEVFIYAHVLFHIVIMGSWRSKSHFIDLKFWKGA